MLLFFILFSVFFNARSDFKRVVGAEEEGGAGDEVPAATPLPSTGVE